MALARPTFLRMRGASGFESTTCTWCVRSIGKGSDKELLILEQAHECDHDDLQRFAPAAGRSRTGIAMFRRVVGEADSQGDDGAARRTEADSLSLR
jgi:hypothetical protein